MSSDHFERFNILITLLSKLLSPCFKSAGISGVTSFYPVRNSRMTNELVLYIKNLSYR
jgi:hypothetical protein